MNADGHSGVRRMAVANAGSAFRRPAFWNLLAVIGWVGLGLLAVWEAGATQGPLVPLEELARRADLVVHGRVESVETLVTGDGRRLTRVELAPVSVWKGGSTNRVGLVLGSGILGERWVKVLGEPDYTPGEEVVVFAVNNDRGEAVTLDLSQGKFSVTRRVGESGAWVSNGMWGGKPESAGGIVRLPHQLPLSLEQLRERVRTAVGHGEVGS